ncbi:hypothetical protein Ddye_015568 [Dipteronia dyeriana]|uniref:Reverse transcriptase domain-containing protein n=1 Tax=Dipteronia dyeriana TaxID=168575 RepID=A0AAD9U648_9ROSI|nr:hypothetical protein Ddye_015568 [Dipteronia dyeriana]
MGNLGRLRDCISIVGLLGLCSLFMVWRKKWKVSMRVMKSTGSRDLEQTASSKRLKFQVFSCKSYARKKKNDISILLDLEVNKLNKLRDFQPISLCCTIYKIVMKVNAVMLKPFLPDIISQYQSAFVLGRQIYDNVMVVFKTLHSLARKKSGNRGHMALKLDISKAYDKVE